MFDKISKLLATILFIRRMPEFALELNFENVNVDKSKLLIKIGQCDLLVVNLGQQLIYNQKYNLKKKWPSF
jgi:hypothetical protein